MAASGFSWLPFSDDRIAACVTHSQRKANGNAMVDFNLAMHVGDDPQKVLANRQYLRDSLQLSAEPVWLQQVHGTRVFDADAEPLGEMPLEADAAVTSRAGVPLVVMTADCLPVLFFSAERVAVAHAGWRGLLNGVLENTVAAMQCAGEQIQCWLGPCIQACHFEVGSEVREAFLQAQVDAASAFTQPHEVSGQMRYMADLPALAIARLQAMGIRQIRQMPLCTCESPQYYSYRKDPQCGRFASLIWIKPD